MHLDIVVPFYNEKGCALKIIPELNKAMKQIQGLTCSYYFVDDGSNDGTAKILDDFDHNNDEINVIHLWGNHGHQKALVAGLDHCRGDAVLMMDGDGQHPVDVAVDMVYLFLNHPGVEMVQGVRGRGQGGLIKDGTSSLFYTVVNCLIPGTRLKNGSSDFRIIHKEVLLQVRKYRDRYRNLRILLSTLSLQTLNFEYIPSRRLSGKSKYDLKRMLKLAMDGIFTFSTLPLRLSLFLMFGTGTLAIAYTLYGLIVYIQGSVVPGWTSMIVLIGLLFSAVFAVLAILAEYINIIYEEVRRHPIYTLKPPFLLKNSSEQYEKTRSND